MQTDTSRQARDSAATPAAAQAQAPPPVQRPKATTRSEPTVRNTTTESKRSLIDPFAPPGTWTRTFTDAAIGLLLVVVCLALAGVLWAMIHRTWFYLKEKRFRDAPPPIKSFGIGTSGVKLEYDINEKQDRQLLKLRDELDTILAKHEVLSDRMDALEEATEEASEISRADLANEDEPLRSSSQEDSDAG